MKYILENKFWWAARSFAAVVVFGVSALSANVFITEIADPNNDAGARFVELHNSGSTDIDLSAEGFKIQRWTNGNADPTASSVKDLTGTIAAQAISFDQKVIFYLNIIITLLITFMILKLGKKLTRKLGTAGLRVIERIMGMILMVVAIQFIIDGLNTVITNYIINFS